jgi:alanyl-tRNA synthetase
VIPGSDGRGYVLRRIIRRAIRHGYKLGCRQPFFHRLVADLSKAMGNAYPELPAAAARVAEVLKAEEERFAETLEHGMALLEAALASPSKRLDGETAFRLYDTFGFPLDLTADICRERGFTLDQAGFDAAMARQRSQARAASKFVMKGALEYAGVATVFHGYDTLVHEGTVVALYKDGSAVNELTAGEAGVVVLDHTPFYAESGGQVGDRGLLESAHGVFEVEDTQKIQADVFGHQGVLKLGHLTVGNTVQAKVDMAARAATMRNHSATHLMHKALREVLGPHVQQKGSLVNPERTRFDFAHHAPMTDDEIRRVERIVNREILANAETRARLMAFDEAVKSGAMALFGEKYGDTVRVLDIGSSRELCGGTHVARSGDIGFFKIVSEGGVAAGIRRVEAVTGEHALEVVQRQERELAEVAAAVRAQPQEIALRVGQLLDNVKALEKELARLKAKMASSQGDDLAARAADVKGVKVLAAAIEGADAKALRDTLDKLKDRLKSCVVVLGAAADGKAALIAGVSADLTGKVKAGELVNFVAGQVGGKGGGRPDMAQAGGTQPEHLAKALASVRGWVEQKL